MSVTFEQPLLLSDECHTRLDGVGGSGNTQRTGNYSNDSSEELPKKAEKLFAMFIGHGCGKLKG